MHKRKIIFLIFKIISCHKNKFLNINKVEEPNQVSIQQILVIRNFLINKNKAKCLIYNSIMIITKIQITSFLFRTICLKCFLIHQGINLIMEMLIIQETLVKISYKTILLKILLLMKTNNIQLRT